MRTFFTVLFAVVLTAVQIQAQVGINTDGSQPDGSAILDTKSTSKGYLPPRMTRTQMYAIQNPASGLVVFCIDCGANSSGALAFYMSGEPALCWITSNLGSDHQATEANAATAASAGWYWQFNRKQGYQDDGTTRTPATEWITPISENSDWQPANDPCAIELGGSWRLPTDTEWSNVDNAEGWANITDTWNSLLKLHAAGYLTQGTGTLSSRGSHGEYRSSSQASLSGGWILDIGPSNCFMYNLLKANGITVRCVK